MKRAARFAALLSLLGSLTFAAQGQGQGQTQPVYRCGQSYSQTPCPGAVSVDTRDARTPAQKQAADQATQRDKRLAQELQETRKKEEALAQAGSTPTPIKDKPVKPIKSKNSKVRTAANDGIAQAKAKLKQKKKPEFFTAAAPPAPKRAAKTTQQTIQPSP